MTIFLLIAGALAVLGAVITRAVCRSTDKALSDHYGSGVYENS